MKRALPLLFALCACSLRAPRVTSAPCAQSAQCDRAAVCFLGECRGHSSALSLVSVEVRPPNDSALAVSQKAGIDLLVSVKQDFPLTPLAVVSGSVLQAQAPGQPATAIAGALVTLTDHAPAIADRVQQVVASTDANGFYSVRVPQGLWDVVVQPPAPAPPAVPSPPYRLGQPISTALAVPALTLPAVSDLVSVHSAVAYDGGVLAGAAVTAVDPDAGFALSAPAEVQADGGVALYLPPGTSAYALRVGPPSDVDAGTPRAAALAALDPLPSYDHLAPAPAVSVPLPPVAVLQGTVVDGAGVGIAGADVYARSVEPGWSLFRSAVTDASGNYTLTLRAGNYVVEAAPVATLAAPAVSGEQKISVLAGGPPLTLRCPSKVRGYGLIAKPNGAVGANFQITATRLADDLLTTRLAYSTPTDQGGIWHITADPGRYRVEVVPPADSGLPRKIVQMDLLPRADNLEMQLDQITLSPPLTVGGVVHGAPPGLRDQPVVNATVSFYALDVNSQSILLGNAATDLNGGYTVVLPDVAQPAVVTSY